MHFLKIIILKRVKRIGSLKEHIEQIYIAEPTQLTARRDCGVEGLEFLLFSASDGIDWPPLPAREQVINNSRIALKRLLGLNRIKQAPLVFWLRKKLSKKP